MQSIRSARWIRSEWEAFASWTDWNQCYIPLSIDGTTLLTSTRLWLLLILSSYLPPWSHACRYGIYVPVNNRMVRIGGNDSTSRVRWSNYLTVFFHWTIEAYWVSFRRYTISVIWFGRAERYQKKNSITFGSMWNDLQCSLDNELGAHANPNTLRGRSDNYFTPIWICAVGKCVPKLHDVRLRTAISGNRRDSVGLTVEPRWIVRSESEREKIDLISLFGENPAKLVADKCKSNTFRNANSRESN